MRNRKEETETKIINETVQMCLLTTSNIFRKENKKRNKKMNTSSIEKVLERIMKESSQNKHKRQTVNSCVLPTIKYEVQIQMVSTKERTGKNRNNI